MKTFQSKTAQGAIRFHDIPGPEDEPPLLFVHGLGCASSCDYPTVAANPALSGRRLLLIDLPGSGFSDHPADFGYGITDHAQTIVEFIRGSKLESVDLFGHSMGGAVAIKVAHLLADRVRHLVLSEPNLDSGGGFFSRKIAEMSEADYLAHGHADLIRTCLTDGNDIWGASLSISSPYAVHRSASSLVLGDFPTWREQLYQLPMPTTVIFGENSLPDPDWETLPKHGINVEMVDQAGHSMAWENPQTLAAAIKRGLTLQ
ncbi:Pimeloyl-ACP methyl ester carboxylesterase [Rhizobium multihospitium]|uniref:Pimeloyl-ACP methyl ester carboxylesterase n=1 Tax=Rhizobium multihospitium TaxID=410764 RepID=A0A1C3UYL5_9HYPH|nr:Pimeloyl-ACP methyl ester carboxylesterase [Rhizobium multihospitium]